MAIVRAWRGGGDDRWGRFGRERKAGAAAGGAALTCGGDEAAAWDADCWAWRDSGDAGAGRWGLRAGASTRGAARGVSGEREHAARLGQAGRRGEEVSWAAQWFDRAGVLGLGWILGLGFGPEERAGRAGLLAGFWAGLVWVLGWFGFSVFSFSFLFLNKTNLIEFKPNLNSKPYALNQTNKTYAPA